MAEHEKASHKNQDAVEQKSRHGQKESQPLADYFLVWDEGYISIGETPFWPQVDKHTALLTMARSDEQRANITLQLQQNYGNKYVQRVMARMKLEESRQEPNDGIVLEGLTVQQQVKDAEETTPVVTGSEEEAEAALHEAAGLLTGGLEQQYIVILLRSVATCQQLNMEEDRWQWAMDEVARVATDLLKARIETIDVEKCRQEITAELLKFSVEVQKLGVDEGIIQGAVNEAQSQAKEQLVNAVWMLRRRPEEAAAETVRRRLGILAAFGGFGSPEVDDAIEVLRMWSESLGWTVG